IGEVYINTCDYDKAKKHIEEARSIAVETKDTNLMFLTNINLGLIYLLTGDYEYSYNCYTMLKEVYAQNSNYSFEVISQYYNFIGEFYYSFGKWDEALKYSNKAIELCKDYNNTEYLMSKTRILLIDYLRDGKYDNKAMEDIRTEFSNIDLKFQRRTNLLQLGILALLKGDYKYVAHILKEDNQLKKGYKAPSLEYIRKILLYSIIQDEDSYENMIKLEEDMKKYNLLHLDIFANSLIGFNLAKNKRYYQALNYLLESLDLIYRIIKNVPQRDLQISFIKSQRTDDIKRKMSEVVFNIFNQKLDCICIDDLNSEEPIEKYFDYNSLFSFMDDSQFAKITEINYLYEETKGIFSIEDLVKSLTDNYKYNLKLILKYIAKKTFAKRGYILIYDEDTNKYIPIISLNGNSNWKPNENLLALANRYENGVLISSSLGSNIIGLHKEFLAKDTRALICIPIAAPSTVTYPIKEERRKSQIQYNRKNDGYIYLETGRIFNRFDKERHKLASTLTRLLYINIENYKLKTLSSIDKLTGTYTRKYFENEFNRILIENKKKNESFAVMMMDLDRFKNINDTYGHRKGDQVLQKIGTILSNSTRNTDTVARYGGEEFIIILKNIKEQESKNIGEKIRERIEKLNISGVDSPITVSIGISMFPKHSQFKEELIEKADQALYCAKEKGRNRVVVWNAELANTLNRVDRLAGILSGNINTDQRNILAILDIIDIAKQNISNKEKKFAFLGRVIEILEAENCAFIEINSNKESSNIYARSRLNLNWIDPDFINNNIVDRVINKREGEFLIDWESVNEINLGLNTPNWQSIIAIPLILKEQIKAVVYITVPIKEKEFDYDNYNLAKVLCDIFSTII
ncbi:tetratricopeptide repeat-containing diguanylate cyclase, partial [Schnuerera sp.]|uniref:tetratricopeptide repeat-containing diguanylate cyclase n=1 Tax=Schnuerera sp. TaxID=2794844 RepID=UPI002CBEFBA8